MDLSSFPEEIILQVCNSMNNREIIEFMKTGKTNYRICKEVLDIRNEFLNQRAKSFVVEFSDSEWESIKSNYPIISYSNIVDIISLIPLITDVIKNKKYPVRRGDVIYVTNLVTDFPFENTLFWNGSRLIPTEYEPNEKFTIPKVFQTPTEFPPMYWSKIELDSVWFDKPRFRDQLMQNMEVGSISKAFDFYTYKGTEYLGAYSSFTHNHIEYFVIGDFYYNYDYDDEKAAKEFINWLNNDDENSNYIYINDEAPTFDKNGKIKNKYSSRMYFLQL